MRTKEEYQKALDDITRILDGVNYSVLVNRALRNRLVILQELIDSLKSEKNEN